MELIITLRKEIEEVAEGEHLYNLVKERLSDKPEVKVTGMVNNHFVEEPEH